MLSYDNELLENAFDVLNTVYFDNALPEAVITIQSTPKVYGHFTLGKVWENSSNSFHEINIGAEYLNRPIENVLATLLHEMVHLFCFINGIADTSNGGRYHNKRFKVEAEKRNLKIEYARYIGYSVTSPTERFIEVLKQHGLYEGIEHCRIALKKSVPPTDGGGTDGKRKSSTRKYICPSCGISVRATKEVNIICGDCMVGMEDVLKP
jgi:hypothetical protein